MLSIPLYLSYTVLSSSGGNPIKVIYYILDLNLLLVHNLNQCNIIQFKSKLNFLRLVCPLLKRVGLRPNLIKLLGAYLGA